MSFRKSLIIFGFVAVACGSAQADLPLGLWQSAPDSTGLVVHVRTKPCGRQLCGRVERAKNLRGYDTPSKAVGSQVLWGLDLQADGSYNGQFWAPDQGKIRSARVRVQGNEMLLHSCDGSACRDEVLQRLR